VNKGVEPSYSIGYFPPITSKPVLYLLGISTKGVSNQTTKEIKVLSLNDLDRWQTDIIMDITNKEVHHWKRIVLGSNSLSQELLLRWSLDEMKNVTYSRKK
jgi:hypothetical protein